MTRAQLLFVFLNPSQADTAALHHPPKTQVNYIAIMFFEPHLKKTIAFAQNTVLYISSIKFTNEL
jgi:hypothetical protein